VNFAKISLLFGPDPKAEGRTVTDRLLSRGQGRRPSTVNTKRRNPRLEFGWDDEYRRRAAVLRTTETPARRVCRIPPFQDPTIEGELRILSNLIRAFRRWVWCLKQGGHRESLSVRLPPDTRSKIVTRRERWATSRNHSLVYRQHAPKRARGAEIEGRDHWPVGGDFAGALGIATEAADVSRSSYSAAG